MQKFFINAEAPNRESIHELQGSGHTVVCAARPISGEHTWYQGEGCMGRGRYYAAAIDVDKYLKHWISYDAWEIVFVTNEQIIEMIAVHCDEKYLIGRNGSFIEFTILEV